MYGEKIESILEDIEDKNIEIAGGSVVGIVLSTVNSLITYIANLTLNKKKYEDVQDNVEEVLKRAKLLKKRSVQAIDKDKEILENLLKLYKIKSKYPEEYQNACKNASDFCMQVLYIANDTYNLASEISKVGNKMMASDFKICKYYALASIHSAIENVYINVKEINDDRYKSEIQNKCKIILENINIDS